MAKKCCKAHPPCKDCPKRRKKKGKSAVDRDNCLICRYVPLAAISISGQRG